MDRLRHEAFGLRCGARDVAAALALAFSLIACGLLGFAAPARADETPPRFFRIGTAATTGTYFVIGAEIANAISKPPGSRDCAHGGSCGVDGLVAVAQATDGSIANALAVGSGQLEGALIQANVAHWAYTGRSPQLKPCRGGTPSENGTALLVRAGAIGDLRAVAALYIEQVHLVARADGKLHSLRDLRDKRVALGEPDSGSLIDARLVLHAAGLSECRVKAQHPRLSEAASLLEHGALDAFFMTGGAPVPAVSDVAAMVPVRLIPVTGAIRDRLARDFGFVSVVIPGGTYPGVAGVTQTVGTTALFVVSAKLSDGLVYGITRALWQDATRRILDNGHPVGKRIRFEDALKGVSIPLHPGAARYYREAGLHAPH
jgi:uncharacterized protein